MEPFIPLILLLICTALAAWMLRRMAHRQCAELSERHGKLIALHLRLNAMREQLENTVPADLWQCTGLWRMTNGDLRLIMGSLRSNMPERDVMEIFLGHSVNHRPALKAATLISSGCMHASTVPRQETAITLATN